MQETLEKVETREWVVIENDNQQIFGVLHRPVACESPPVVVALHGFASSKLGSNRCYVTLAEEFAKAGLAVLRFDFRGSGDSEGDMSQMPFNGLVSDSVKVIQYLEGLESVDASRLGLFGASLGGAISILAQANYSKAKALALWAPVASGELWYRDFLTQHGGQIPDDPEKLLSSYKGVKLGPQFRAEFAQMFAYKTVQELKDLPILHMHGEKDQTISLAHQEAFKLNCGPNTQFVTYPDGEHALGFSASFPDVIERSVTFFKKYL